MARRKKTEWTGIRKKVGSSKENRRSFRIVSQQYGSFGEEETQPKRLGGFWTIFFSLLLLIAIIICNNIRLSHKGEASGRLSVHFIDVGQGDSILIECGGESMLIDCGEASKADKVCSYLNERDIDSLDYVIGTHFHSDHMGAMSEIVKNYDIGEFIVPPFNAKKMPTEKYFERFLDAAEEKKMKLRQASAGKKYTLGDAEWEIIAPLSKESSSTNNTSVGIILTFGDTRFFLAGDAEESAEKAIVEARDLPHINVYKAGHHGSNTSSSEALLDVIRPDIAVISCGEGNSYGHPGEKALERIKKYTDKIYRTDRSGSIVITSDGRELKVSTERK